MCRLGESHRPFAAWVTATSDGLWTVTSSEEELADPFVDVWELTEGLISRWRLDIESEARVYTVNGPTDWEQLVAAYPLARGQRPNSSWELPGPNQSGVVDELMAVDGQQVMRTKLNRFVEPNWDQVADDWDAVHLTWAGFLTTEGLIIDLGHDDIAMLRNWHSERTLWLNPVLFDPQSLPAPMLSGAMNGTRGIDAGADPTRRQQDLDWLGQRQRWGRGEMSCRAGSR